MNPPNPSAAPSTTPAGQAESMLPQLLWFGFFVALMFLLPPLVAMDLVVP